MTPKIRHQKIILILFFLVLLGPLCFAWVLVQKRDHFAFRKSNHGDLILAPINLSTASFYDLNHKKNMNPETLLGKWWLVYVAPMHCQQTCHEVLYNMRQIHTALGKDRTRLERLFIAHPDCQASVCETYLSESYPDMKKVRLPTPDFLHLFGTTRDQTEQEIIGELYIVDPHGNIMMHYSSSTEPRGILSDLKHLLKVSKIG